MPRKTLRAIAILVGTTIGAGIFGIPYVVARIGFLPGLVYLLALGGVVLLLNLIYGEVILRTPGDHQLTGYGQIYLGKGGQSLASLGLFVSLYGALLAYLIKIGEFLALILGFPYPIVLSLIFFFFASAAIYFGLRAISQIEIVLIAFIIFFIILIALIGVNQISLSNLKTININLQTIGLPYGVILFALTGAASVPEMEEVLRRQPHKLKKAIIIGTLIPLLTYFIFTSAIVGISGKTTSDDAISGLVSHLPQWVVKVGALLGTLTMGTSFLTLGYVLREVWFRDYKLPKTAALSLACLPPLALFLLGAKNFISVLGITGALTGGLTGILIILLHQKASRPAGRHNQQANLGRQDRLPVFGPDDGGQTKKISQREPAYHLKIPTAIYWLLGIIFFLGMLSPWWT